MRETVKVKTGYTQGNDAASKFSRTSITSDTRDENPERSVLSAPMCTWYADFMHHAGHWTLEDWKIYSYTVIKLGRNREVESGFLKIREEIRYPESRGLKDPLGTPQDEDKETTRFGQR